jgi:hypothetical protein
MLTLGPPKRNDQSANDDEGSAEVNRLRRRLMKLQLRDDLSDKKELHNIDTQEFSEFDFREIQK